MVLIQADLALIQFTDAALHGFELGSGLLGAHCGILDPLGQPCHALIDRFDTRPHGLHLASQPRQSLTAVRLLPDRRQVCPVGLGGAALPVGPLCTGSIESGTRRVQLR
ncbi:Uncharacterised protein [Mycobacterium tuberculosis]|nr:Uncharacterised protein [Mycobacterium tuberculosis]